MGGSGMKAPKKRLRQPRVAEIVASSLRARILSGALADGDMLPKQEELLTEFGVSPPAIREAFRILETEGLITVLRGNVGGAIIHVPHPGTAAYMLGLVLQARSVSLMDLSDGMRQLEPACAAQAALRPDRETTVLPQLRANIDACMAAIDDPNTFIGLARAFHTELVSNCGNETMSLVVGALENLWSAQVDVLARSKLVHGSFADRSVRLSLAREHERIYRAIEEGDAQSVERAIREHYTAGGDERRHGFDTAATVMADALRH
ncbi:GntR family transcriptional regulator [Sphingobium sp. BS19]|nr:GntR family transcriptional regulator [Sphingobium sp. BS19]